MTAIRDDFNRANVVGNGTGIGASPTGGVTPTTTTNQWTIDTNRLTYGNSSIDTILWDAGITDANAEIKIVGAASNMLGPVLRAADANNYWIFWGNSGLAGIWKMIAGSLSQVATWSGSFALNDVAKFTVVGNVYTGYVNGTSVVTYTDSSGFTSTATKHGIFSNANTGVCYADYIDIAPSGATTLNGAVAMTAATTTLTATAAGPGTVSGAVAMANATATLTAAGTKTTAAVKNGAVSMTRATASLSATATQAATAAVTMSAGAATLTAAAGIVGAESLMASATTSLVVGGTLDQAAAVAMTAATATLTVTQTGPYVHDTFTRADSSTIGSGEIGSAPTVIMGTLVLASNAVKATAAPAVMVYDTATDVRVDAVLAGDAYGVKLHVRSAADGSTKWETAIDWDGTVDISVFQLGGYTFKATTTLATGPVAGDTLSFKVLGNVYTTYLNSTEVLTYTDTGSIGATNTWAGVRFIDTTSTLDEVMISPATASLPPTVLALSGSMSIDMGFTLDGGFDFGGPRYLEGSVDLDVSLGRGTSTDNPLDNAYLLLTPVLGPPVPTGTSVTTGGVVTGGTTTGGVYTGGVLQIDGTLTGGIYTGGTTTDGTASGDITTVLVDGTTVSGGTLTGGTTYGGTIIGGVYTPGTQRDDGTWIDGTLVGGINTGATTYGGTLSGGTVVEPYNPGGTTIKWNVWDGANTFGFAINPSSMSSVYADATVEAQGTTGGGVVVMEGNPKSGTLTFSGSLLDQSQYETLVVLLRKKRRLMLFDHLTRSYEVIFTSFKPVPRRGVAPYPWHHDYSATCLILRSFPPTDPPTSTP